MPKRLPPSVLAVRRDLRVLQYPTSQTNTQITRDSEHIRGKPLGQTGPGAADGVLFLSFLFLGFLRESRGTARSEAKGFARGLRNGRWLGEPLGGGPVNMLHVSVHYGPRTLRYTLQARCAADCQRFASIAAHFTFSI